jgi:peptidoglycan/xylan/chitin deacetylase (PgdA/CDA1 family)
MSKRPVPFGWEFDEIYAFMGRKEKRMLIRRQDIATLVFYYFGYSRIRNFVSRLRGKAQVRFVTYHDIPPGTEKHFESQIHFLKRKTNVIGIDDFMKGRLSTKKPNIVITFDDGYQSWAVVATSILKKWGLPATFFVSSGFIGLSKDEETEFMRSQLCLSPAFQKTAGGLSIQDVHTLAEQGFIIGGHTLNHCHMGRIRDRGQLIYEIEEDKKRLEAATGQKVEFFSYPFGECCHPEIDLVQALKESGYRGAVTTAPGLNDLGTNPYLLNRELAGVSLTSQAFRARVYGNADAVRFVKRIVGYLVR